jgi:hypothetical protein
MGPAEAEPPELVVARWIMGGCSGGVGGGKTVVGDIEEWREKLEFVLPLLYSEPLPVDDDDDDETEEGLGVAAALELVSAAPALLPVATASGLPLPVLALDTAELCVAEARRYSTTRSPLPPVALLLVPVAAVGCA